MQRKINIHHITETQARSYPTASLGWFGFGLDMNRLPKPKGVLKR
jgi:hypothetical protein